MQPVYQGEVDMTTATDADATFGYQDAYDEYRHLPSHVSGEFRTSKANWSFNRKFATKPALNSSFIECTLGTADSPFASTTVDNFQIMLHHSLRARRLISQTGTPYSS